MKQTMYAKIFRFIVYKSVLISSMSGLVVELSCIMKLILDSIN